MRELALLSPRVFDGEMAGASRALGLPPLFHLVRGDTMAPTLKDGDYAVVDRGQQRLVEEGLWLLRFPGGALVVRRLDPRPDRVRVICDNALYLSEDVAPERLRVVGRVIGTIKAV